VTRRDGFFADLGGALPFFAAPFIASFFVERFAFDDGVFVFFTDDDVFFFVDVDERARVGYRCGVDVNDDAAAAAATDAVFFAAASVYVFLYSCTNSSRYELRMATPKNAPK
jgi:hypothetical protein